MKSEGGGGGGSLRKDSEIRSRRGHGEGLSDPPTRYSVRWSAGLQADQVNMDHGI